MRSTLVDSAESMLNALATLPISMSGSLRELDDVRRHAGRRRKIHQRAKMGFDLGIHAQHSHSQ